MATVLSDVQKISLSINPVTAAGNPAPVDGVPAWSSSDPAILTVTASADGLSAVAETTGALGNAQVQVTADADVGSGTTEISAVLDVSVIASAAVSLGIVAGVPESRL